MKIHSIKQHPGQRRSATVSGMLAACGTILLGATMCSSANAQGDYSDAKPKVSPSQTGTSAGRQIALGDQSYQVITAADVPTAADGKGPRSQPQAVQSVSWPAPCASCGTGCGGTCGGSYAACGTCGGNCRGTCGSGYSPFSGFGNPCAPCQPFCYVSFDALYMERDGKDEYSLSPNYVMGGFDLELGGRITVGSVPNCVDGYEATFTGPLQWDMAATLNDPGGGILTFLTPRGLLVPADLSAFNDTVVASSQFYEAEYWSVEGNKSLISWDFAKLLYGIRYSEYNEDYLYASRNNAGQSGLLASSTQNRLLGIQGGLDLLYPISRHAFTDFRSRLGAFVNFAESDFGLINDGALVVANSDDTESLSAILELGAGVRYQLGQMLAVRAGVELWYLTGIAAANEQFTAAVSPRSGGDVVTNDDILVTGISLGAELRY